MIAWRLNLLSVAVVLASTACSTSVEPSAILSAGGSQISGEVSVNYVSISAAGPTIAYETGSFAEDPLSDAHVPAEVSIHEATRFQSLVAVTGPRSLVEPMADTLLEGLEHSRAWRPSGFTGSFDIALDLVRQGPVNFSRRFTFARSPWPMAFQAPYDQAASAQARAKLTATIVHEGYHLANAVAGAGRNLSQFRSRPDAGAIYEETSARLVGACVVLSLGQSADLTSTPAAILDAVNPVTGEERVIEAPFSNEILGHLVTALEAPHQNGTYPHAPLYLGFYRTLFERFSEGRSVIDPQTVEADRLLTACARTGPDPTQIPPLLLESDAAR